MEPSELPNIGKLAKALNSSNVRWVLVGGMAVMFHGGFNVTFDADLAFEKSVVNLDAIKNALECIHARPVRASNFGAFELDRSVLMAPFMHMKSEAGFVDLINRLPGVDSFDGLYQRADVFLVEGEEVRVASIDDLIAMKSQSDRQKDADHIRALLAIKALQSE